MRFNPLFSNKKNCISSHLQGTPFDHHIALMCVRYNGLKPISRHGIDCKIVSKFILYDFF